MRYFIRFLQRFMRPRRETRPVLFEPLERRQVPTAVAATIDSVSVSTPVSGPITSNSNIQITSHDVIGKSDSVVVVVYFLDLNNNGIIDSHDRVLTEGSRIAGTDDFVGTIAARKLPLGNDTILAHAVTSNGGFSTVQGGPNNTVSVTVVPGPSIDSLSISSTVLPKTTSKITLSAVGVRAGDKTAGSKITGVNFYLDANDDGIIDAGDPLLGAAPVSRSSIWTLRNITLPAGTDLTHSVQFLAQAVDATGRLSAPVSIVAGPQMKTLAIETSSTITPATTKLTLIAAIVQTPGAHVTDVLFWQDTNHDGILDAGDTELGTGKRTSTDFYQLKIDLATTTLSAPTTGFLAQITDSKGIMSLAYFAPVTDTRPI